MNVSLSVLKENPAKYFELAKRNDIIVTRRGERLGRIVSEEKALNYDKLQAFDALMALSAKPSSLPPEYHDPNYDPNYDLLRETIQEERNAP